MQSTEEPMDNEQTAPAEEEVEEQPTTEPTLDEEVVEEAKSEEPEKIQLTVEETADQVVQLLKDKNMKKVATFVHPEHGVRFSPYGYIDVDQDLVFSKEEVAGLWENEQVYHWGYFDGKGDPIEKTFADYYDRFVYDADYVHAEEKAVDERLGHGNTLDNTKEIYPDGTVVEYHFSGFEEQYEGMDWRSLRLVLIEENDKWYLVSVIHDEWTI